MEIGTGHVNIIDDLTRCSKTGIGYNTNIVYRRNGPPKQQHGFEDASINVEHNQDVFLYGVFDGHENHDPNSKIGDFVSQKMAAEIIFDNQLNKDSSFKEVKDIIKRAFEATERAYLSGINEKVARLEAMQMEDQNPLAGTNIPLHRHRMDVLQRELAGGSTALVALLCDNRLYIANSGDSRALLCKVDEERRLRIYQLSSEHNLDSKDELHRLGELGLSEDVLRHPSLPRCSRCLGDWPRKSGYKKSALLRNAQEEPVIYQPEFGPIIEIDDTCQFLLLMTSGVYTCLEDSIGNGIYGSRENRDLVNRELARIVAEELYLSTLSATGVAQGMDGIAQAVVDRICRIHKDIFDRCDEQRAFLCQGREDMTLLIRVFNNTGTLGFTNAQRTQPEPIPLKNAPGAGPPAMVKPYVDFSVLPDWMRNEEN